ncbi:MAG: hypothetical protein GY913_02880 [Proteobacteria bacterium]|nr:hypothetical protein [Pseudomonadota bacterium]MCP4915843.1 hypothetical protein [Pseudomonadota bacterium]
MTWAKRIGGVVLDLVLLAVIAWVRWLKWIGISETESAGPSRAREVMDVPEWWWDWGTGGDFGLFGPDAGNWAANARTLVEGGVPDLNRLPVHGWATALFAQFTGDYVFGGHLMNHAALLGTGVFTYWLGRQTSGRGPALLAGVLVVTSPTLLLAAQLYGSDPILGCVVAALLACTVWAVRGPAPVVVLAGALAGVVMATHYLGLLFPLPCALAMLFHQGDWRRRVAGPVVFLVVGAAVFAWLMAPYPTFSMTQVFSVYSEGVLGSQQGGGSGMTTAVSFVGERFDGAPTAAFQYMLGAVHLTGVPWGLCIAGFWIGVLGLGLPPQDTHRKLSWDWRIGLFLFVLLIPLVFLEAARAPFRYRLYAFPLVFLLFARGLGSVLALADLGVRRFWKPWPAGWLALVACGVVAWVVQPTIAAFAPGPGTWEEGWYVRQVGEFVADNYGTDGPVVSRSQGMTFHSERTLCPSRRPQGSTSTLEAAKAVIVEQCRPTGILPYIIESGTSSGPQDGSMPVLDRWVEDNYEPVLEVDSSMRTATVYAVPAEAFSASP